MHKVCCLGNQHFSEIWVLLAYYKFALDVSRLNESWLNQNHRISGAKKRKLVQTGSRGRAENQLPNVLGQDRSGREGEVVYENVLDHFNLEQRHRRHRQRLHRVRVRPCLAGWKYQKHEVGSSQSWQSFIVAIASNRSWLWSRFNKRLFAIFASALSFLWPNLWRLYDRKLRLIIPVANLIKPLRS